MASPSAESEREQSEPGSGLCQRCERLVQRLPVDVVAVGRHKLRQGDAIGGEEAQLGVAKQPAADTRGRGNSSDIGTFPF
jgi:hypothetical protein